MSDSYTNLLNHIVFSTKDRRPLRGLSNLSTTDSWGLRPRLYAAVRSADFA
jgi:hypothetical protein